MHQQLFKWAYIVPTDTIPASMPLQPWGATPIPDDPSNSFVTITWDNPNFHRDFETRSDILIIGAPWETVPEEAVSALASLQQQYEASNPVAPIGGRSLLSAGVDSVAATDTVHKAMRKCGVSVY